MHSKKKSQKNLLLEAADSFNAILKPRTVSTVNQFQEFVWWGKNFFLYKGQTVSTTFFYISGRQFQGYFNIYISLQQFQRTLIFSVGFVCNYLIYNRLTNFTNLS